MMLLIEAFYMMCYCLPAKFTTAGPASPAISPCFCLQAFLSFLWWRLDSTSKEFLGVVLLKWGCAVARFSVGIPMLGKRSRPPTGIISKLNFVCAEDRDQDPYNAKASGKPYFSAGRIALGFEIPLHTKPSNACESPRSVLDVGACDSEKHLRGRSLRSCLPAPPLRKVGDQGVGLAIIVKIHADEIGYDVSERHYDNRSQPITIGVNYHIQRQASVHKPSTCAGSSRDASEGDDEDNEYDDNGSEHDDHGDESQRMGDYNLFKSMEIFCSDHPSPLQKDFVHSNNAASTDCAVRPSIFSVASIPSGYDSYNIQDINFLDACANCQRAFAPGKDIFMYRGDQAFCSIQCRAKGSKKMSIQT